MKKIEGSDISLVFADKNYIRSVYDMLTSEKIKESMFNDQFPAPTWEEFREEEYSYFKGVTSFEGNYLLIKEQGLTIGSICYSSGDNKIRYAELDIWMAGTTYTGRGLGPKAIRLLIDYLYRTYKIKTFLIRPWIKNQRAIKAYKKCGFLEDPLLKLKDYYNRDDLEKYGAGDYGDETVTLIKNIHS